MNISNIYYNRSFYNLEFTIVDSLPNIQIVPSVDIIYATPSSTVNLTCYASGFHTVLLWRKGNRTLLYRKLDSVNGKGLLLKVENIVESATYECQAINAFGTTSSSVQLIVQGE